MRIGIDARFFGSLGKGLGRYTQKLIENLEKIDAQNEYYIFLLKENFEEYSPKSSNFHKILADFRWYSFAEQISFPKLLHKYALDLMHFPHFNVPLLYSKKFIITIHDLILLHFPTLKNTTLNPLLYWLKFFAYKLTIFSAIKRSQKIITVSQFTKKDILTHYGIVENKIVVTYEASENFLQKGVENDAKILEKYGIIKPYLLYVGNAYPHKNLERLVSSFELVGKEKSELNMVLVGKHDYFYSQLKKKLLQKKISKVILPGFIPDEQLRVIYENARAFVFPSLYEGFGLPPLEAMERGTPVISSDHPCMREVLGESAFFVNAKNEKLLAQGILEFLNDSALGKEFVEKGYRQIQKYSWRKMAEQTLFEYQKIIKEK